MKKPRRSISRLWLFAPVVGLLVAGAWWWSAQRSQPIPVPVVDTTPLEPSARQTLEQHLAAVRKNPKSAAAWGELGSVLRAFDFPREARHCFAAAERLDPRNPRWPYFQGLLLMPEDPPAAIAAFRRAVARGGNEPEMPRLRLARLLSEQGRWPEAETELRALLSQKPDFAPATLLLAHGANADQRTAEAIDLALRCTKDPLTAKSAWALLATLYRRAGDATKAAEAAQIAASSRSDETIVDPFQVEAAARRENPREIALQTHDLLATGQLEDATRNIERLVKGHPQFPETWLLLGRLQILRRQFSEAERSLRRHLELEPDSTQGLFQLGTALFSQNRFPEAAEVFGKAIEIKPDFGPAHFNRAFAFARSGKRHEAVPCFREAIRHNPEYVESYVLLGDLLRQLGKREEALKVIREGLALAGTEPRLRQLEAQLAQTR
jgi:tetratricopeptide (TPR) repeat protein